MEEDFTLEEYYRANSAVLAAELSKAFDVITRQQIIIEKLGKNVSTPSED